MGECPRCGPHVNRSSVVEETSLGTIAEDKALRRAFPCDVHGRPEPVTDEKLHPGETPCGRCGRTLPTLISQAAIAAAVRSAVDAHGPITREQIGSAAKRIYGQLKAERRAQHQCGDDSLDENGPRPTPTQPDGRDDS